MSAARSHAVAFVVVLSGTTLATLVLGLGAFLVERWDEGAGLFALGGAQAVLLGVPLATNWRHVTRRLRAQARLGARQRRWGSWSVCASRLYWRLAGAALTATGIAALILAYRARSLPY